MITKRVIGYNHVEPWFVTLFEGGAWWLPGLTFDFRFQKEIGRERRNAIVIVEFPFWFRRSGVLCIDPLRTRTDLCGRLFYWQGFRHKCRANEYAITVFEDGAASISGINQEK
jgi:hypothetical protein